MKPTPVILVVEDQQCVRERICDFLRTAGFEVIEAADGIEALLLAAEKTPDLLVSDVNMPGLDGLKLVRALHRIEATRFLPVIFLTASTDVNHLAEGINAGARHYLSKPVYRLDLLRKVATALPGARRVG